MKSMAQKIADEFKLLGTDDRDALETVGPPDPFEIREGVPELISRIGASYMRFARDQAFSSRRFQSPIEVLMYFALQAYAYEVFDWPDLAYHECRLGEHREKSLDTGSPHIGICTQHQLGPYHLDFLVTAYDLQLMKEPRVPTVVGRVAVETDGHDFHERTKEQAKHDRRKDRFVQAAGLKILRFTGSEVNENPIRCAKEAIDAAFGRDTAEHLKDYADPELIAICTEEAHRVALRRVNG